MTERHGERKASGNDSGQWLRLEANRHSYSSRHEILGKE